MSDNVERILADLGRIIQTHGEMWSIHHDVKERLFMAIIAGASRSRSTVPPIVPAPPKASLPTTTSQSSSVGGLPRPLYRNSVEDLSEWTTSVPATEALQLRQQVSDYLEGYGQLRFARFLRKLWHNIGVEEGVFSLTTVQTAVDFPVLSREST